MHLPLTYGQCLRKIMQSNHLSINTLCRKMGYHSTTQISRILSDKVSPTLITKFHHQFMLIFDWLISPAEIRELSTSMQYSCLGHDVFLTRRALHRMLFERTSILPEAVSLQMHSTRKDKPHTMQDLLRNVQRHQAVDLLILGSSLDALLPVFTALSSSDPTPDNLHIRHYFVMEENAARIIARVSSLLPFLNTHVYEGAYCTESSPEAARFLTHNQIAVARTTRRDGTFRTTVFLSPQKDGLPVCQIEGDTLYAFYAQQLAAHLDQMRPVKSIYPKPKTVDSLLTLCERDLLLEQNRTCCFVRLDLCFPVFPTQAVLAATANGARLGLTEDEPLMRELIHIHQARCRNIMTKEQPTYFILSRPAMADFAKTGHMSDHLFAMRNFTPAERRAVIAPLAEAMRSGKSLHIHFLADDTLAPVSSFSAYEEMGVQVSANNTAYNVAEDHSEVFIGMPEFEASFRSYCINTLIPEYCLNREESLAWLDHLLAQLDALPEE